MGSPLNRFLLLLFLFANQIVIAEDVISIRIRPQIYMSADTTSIVWDRRGASEFSVEVTKDGLVSETIQSDSAIQLFDYKCFDTIRLKLQFLQNGYSCEELTCILFAANFAQNDRLCLWLDADFVDTVSGGKVISWLDQSRRKFDMAQSTDSRMPVVKNYDDFSFLHFSGNFLSNAFYDLDSIKSTYVMLRHDGVTDGYNFILSKTHNSEGAYTLTKYDDIARNYIDGATFNTDIAITPNWQILSYRYNEGIFATESGFYDIHKQSLAVDYSGHNDYPLTIGKDAATNRYYFGGDIAEILIFSRSLSDQENLFVKKYLSWKYSPPIHFEHDLSITDSFCGTVIHAGSSYSSYLWDDGSTSESRTVSGNGTYCVTVENLFGETSSDSITVTYPKVALRDTFFCSGDSTFLTTGLDPDVFNFVWSTGETSDTIWIKAEGDYSVEVFDTFGCSKISNTVTVTENTFPQTDFLPTDSTLCQGNSLHPKLSNKSLLSFVWDDGGTDSLTTISAEKKYSATITDSDGCQATDSVTITVQGTAPNVDFRFDTVCYGNATSFIDLTSSSDQILRRSWNFNNENSGESTSELFQFATSGTKTVSLEIETATGCIERIAKSVIVGEIPSVSFSIVNGNFGCNTQTIALDNRTSTHSDQIAKWQWSFGNNDISGNQHPSYIYPVAGEYDIELSATTEFNCNGKHAEPIVIYENILQPCIPTLKTPQNNTLLLDTAIHFYWESTCNAFAQVLEIAQDEQFANMVMQIDLAPGKSTADTALGYGTYWWRVKNINACKDTATSEAYTFEIFAPQLIPGMELWLHADKGTVVDEYGQIATWNDFSGNSNNVFQTNASARPKLVQSAIGNKPAVRFDGANDLLVGNNLYVDEHNTSIFIVHKFDGLRKNAHQHLLCQYGDVGIKYRVWAPANTNYRLSYGSIGNSSVGAQAYSDKNFTLTSIVSSSQTEFYSNSGLNASGTVGNFAGMETEFVIGSYASNNTSQLFSGDIAEIIIFDKTITQTEREKIEAYLYSKYQPDPVDLGDDIYNAYSLCPDTLRAPDAYTSYQWSTGSESQYIETILPGTYSVTAEDCFGIASIDTVNIFRPRLNYNDTTICAGEDVIIKPASVSGYTYFWSDGATDSARSITMPDTYSLTVSDSLGCAQTFEDRAITVDSFPNKMNIGNDHQILCENRQISIASGTENVATYLWHDGSTAPYYPVTKSETVSLTATDTQGCTAIDSVSVSLQGTPVVAQFTVDGFCFGSSTTLTNTSGPADSIADIFWTIDGFMASKADVFNLEFDQEGWHSINLKTVNVSGCTDSKEASIFVNAKPDADFESSISCADAEHRFISTSTGGNGMPVVASRWNFDNEAAAISDTAYHRFTSPGQKTVSLTVANPVGCEDSKTHIIDVVSDYLPAAKASLLTPQLGAIFADAAIHFEWQIATNAYRYTILVSTRNDFSDTVAKAITYNTAIDLAIAGTGTFHWKVISENICAYKTQSSVSDFTISPLDKQPSLVLWLKADAGIVSDANGSVSQWNDQSAKANHAKQTNASLMPVVQADAINNKPSVHFDGINDYFSLLSTGINAADMTIFIVSKFAEAKASNINALLTQKTNTGVRYSLFAPANTGNQLQLNSYPPDEKPLQSISYGTDFYRITRVVGKADSSFIYTNSQLSGKAKTKTQSGTDQTLVLGGYFTNTPAFGFSGEIAEVIVFDTALSDSNIDSIENYLYTKYTTPLELGNDIDYALCQTAIDAPLYYNSYAWGNGATETSIPITGNGTYHLTVTDMFGKLWNDSIKVTRPFPKLLNDTTICSGEIATWDLQMPTSYSVAWSTGKTGSALTIADAGTYYATIADSLGCSETIAPAVVAVDYFADSSSIQSDETMCKGELVLFETADQTPIDYEWSTGSTLGYATVSASGNYSLTATNERGCTFADDANVSVAGQAPAISINLPQICNGAVAEFAANVSAEESDPLKISRWIFNGDTVNVQIATHLFNESKANITFEAITNGGCIGSFVATKPVLFNPQANFETYFGSTHCAESQVTFEAIDIIEDSVASLDWSFGATGTFASTTFETGKNPVTLTKTLSNGCVSTHTDTLSILETIPNAEEIKLAAPEDGMPLLVDTVNFLWQPSEYTKYYSFRLSNEPNLDFALTLDSLVDTDLELVLTENQTYFWQVWAHSFCGDTTKSALYSFTKTDITDLHPTVWVDASQIANTTNGQTVTVWGNSGYPLFSQTNQRLAPLFIEKFDAIGGKPALRFEGLRFMEGPSSINIEQMQTVVALVRVGEPAGYQMMVSKSHHTAGAYTIATQTGTNIFKLYLNETEQNGTIDNVGWTLVVCQVGDNQVKTFVDGHADIDSELTVELTGKNIYPLTIGKDASSNRYYFEGDIAEFVAFDSFLDQEQLDFVTDYFKTKYKPTLELPDTIYADVFEPITISASEGFKQYIWSNGLETNSFLTDTSGTYTLTATDTWNNSHIAKTTVIFPTPTILPDTSLCQGKTITWSAGISGNFNFEWYKNGALLQKDVDSVTIKASGYYQLGITDEFGGKFMTDSVMVTFIDLTGSLSLGDSATICENALLEPSRLPENIEKYEWSTGLNQPYIYIKSEGNYSLSVTNTIGCQTSDSVYVKIAGKSPDLHLALDDLCENEQSYFFADVQTDENIAEIYWEVGGIRKYVDTLKQSFPAQDGYVFKVSVELESGCKSVAYDTVDVLLVPDVSIGIFPGKKHCVGNEYTLTADGANIAEYNWHIVDGDQYSTKPAFNPVFSQADSVRVQLDVMFDNQCMQSAMDSLMPQQYFPNATMPILSAPSDNSTVFAPTTTFSWQEENAAYYRLDIASDSLFSNIVFSKDSLLSTLFDYPLVDGTYYWRITAFSHCGGSEKSDVSFFEKSNLEQYNPVIWVAADNLSGKDQSKVQNFKYKSYQGFSQPDSVFMPRYHKSIAAIGDMPAIEFVGNTFMEGAKDLPLDTMRTIFAMVENTAVGNYGMVFSKNHVGDGSLTLAKNNADTKFRLYVDGTNNMAQHEYPGWSLVCFSVHSNKLQAFFDGKITLDQKIDSDAKGLNEYPITIGKQAGVNNFYFNGKLAELIVFSDSITEADYQKIKDYFTYKYQPQLDLPDTIISPTFKPYSVAAAEGFRYYTWNNGSSDHSTVADTTGMYTVTATDFFGRKKSTDVYIRYPQILLPVDTAFCNGTTAQWNSGLSAPFSFVWEKDGSELSSTGSKLTITESGYYQLTAIDSAGYSQKSRLVYFSKIDPTAFITMNDSATLCANQIYEPQIHTESKLHYVWNNGTTEQITTVTDAGYYSVTATDGNGCHASDSIFISIKGIAPELSIAPDTVCMFEPVVFIDNLKNNSDFELVNYQWEISDSILATDSAQISFGTADDFLVKLQADAGNECFGSAFGTIHVKEVYAGSISVFPDTVSCIGSQCSFSFLSEQPSTIASYLWSNSHNGATSSSSVYETSFDADGTHAVKLAYGQTNGCSAEQTQTILTTQSLPKATAPHIVQPKNHALLFSNKINIKWNADSIAYCTLRLSNSNDFSSIQYKADSLQTDSISIANLPNGTYYLVVSAHGYCGDIKNSDTISFELLDMVAYSPLLWLDANTMKLQDAASVQSWSYRNKSLIQTTPSKQAIFEEETFAINNKSSIKFGNSSLQGMEDLPLDSLKTIFLLANIPKTGSYQMLLSKEYSGEGSFTIAKNVGDAKLRIYSPGGTFTSTDQFPGWNLFAIAISDTEIKLFCNGQLTNTFSLSSKLTGMNDVPLTLGKNGGSDSYYFGGSIAELMIFDYELPDDAIEKTTQYFKEKYTATLSLPDTVAIHYGFKPVVVAPNSGFSKYAWSNGETSESITASENGTYTLTVTDMFGREQIDSVFVQMVSPPYFVDTAFCFNGAIELDAELPGEYLYEWSTGSTAKSIHIDSTGEYALTITDGNGYSITRGPINVDIDFFSQEASLGPDISVCKGNRIGLVSRAEGVTHFEWSDGTTNATLQIEQTGTYTLWAKNTRGCEMRDTITATVSGIAPNVNFSWEGKCSSDSVSFTSLASSTDGHAITGLLWKVGDNTYTSNTVHHLFSQSGTFTILHGAEKSDGCRDSMSKKVTIYATPQVDFLPVTACNKQQVAFRPTNIVSKDDIARFTWNLDGTLSGEEQPQVTFDTMGSVPVSLTAETSSGCSYTVTNFVEIKPVAQAKFIYSPICYAKTAAFYNATETSATNPIVENQWSMNGIEFNTSSNYEYTFSNIGNYDISLTVKTVNGCQSRYQEMVTISPLPKPYLSFDPSCSGDTVELKADSIENETDSMVYSWYIDSVFAFNGKSGIRVFDTVGTYGIGLKLETANGCSAQATSKIDIQPSPVAGFRYLSESQKLPFEIELIDTSAGKTESYWIVGGQDTVFPSNPFIMVDDTLPIDVVQYVFSSTGCTNSYSQTVPIQYGKPSLSAIDMLAYQDDDYANAMILVENNGPVSVETIWFYLEVNNDQFVRELWTGSLPSGQEMQYNYVANIVTNAEQLSKVCAFAAYEPIAGSVVYTDTLCMSATERFKVLPIYPNPAKEYIQIDYSIDANCTVHFEVQTVNGQVIATWGKDVESGYNSEKIAVKHLTRGVYTLKISTPSGEKITRFVKH